MNYSTTTVTKNWYIFRERTKGMRMVVELGDILSFSEDAGGGILTIRGDDTYKVVETFDRFLEMLSADPSRQGGKP